MKSDRGRTKVVFDTNVLISALVFGGTPRKVVDLIAQKTIRPIMSEEIMTELRRITVAKFPQYRPGLLRYEKLLRHYALWVPLGLHAVKVSRDPDDNAIIETALAGGANHIISGDNDLLILGSYQRIRIIKPGDFLAQVS